MKYSTVKNTSDELLLIKAAHNGSIEAENVLYSYHKKALELALYKYNFLQVILDDLTAYIECSYRIAIHKYRIESNMKFIDFASWFIKNTLERECEVITVH
ncbi:hypothetical protein HWV00_17085 [Moritella sp. 24]|uniref:hypothetical protein n=1 Tax=Moritella sp. 24 TaxID=2746230 RepID=UPI001BAD5D37|nr:hypothetical protein [Moritella sp. 24]QUM77799.1 hypothetical protein HWV00_17085 [Moritella sp. 24]